MAGKPPPKPTPNATAPTPAKGGPAPAPTSLKDILGQRDESEAQTEKVVDAIEKNTEAVTANLGNLQSSTNNVANTISSQKDSKETEKEKQSALRNMFKSISGNITKGFDVFKKGMFQRKKGGLIDSVLTFIGTIGAIAPIAIGSILSAIEEFFPKVEPFVKALKFVGYAIFGPIMGVIDFAVGFFKGFVGSEESNFAKKIVDGLVGGFAGIIETLTLGFIEFDVITEWLDPVFQPFKDFIDNMITVWGDEEATIMEKLWSSVTGFFGALFDSIVTYYSQLAPLSQQVFASISDWFMNFVTVTIPTYWPIIKEKVIQSIDAIGDWLYKFFTEDIPAGFKAFGRWFQGVFERPIEIMSDFFAGIILYIDTLVAKANLFIAEALDAIPLYDNSENVKAAQRAVRMAEQSEANLQKDIASRAKKRLEIEKAEENAKIEKRFAAAKESGSDEVMGAYLRSLDAEQVNMLARAEAEKTGRSLESVTEELRFARRGDLQSYREMEERRQQNTTIIQQTNTSNQNLAPDTSVAASDAENRHLTVATI